MVDIKLSAQVCKHRPWFHHNPRSQPLVVSPTKAHVRCGWRTGTAPSRYSRCLRCPPAGGSDLPQPSLALLVEVSIWSKKSEIRRLNMTQKIMAYIYYMLISTYINIYQHLGEIETLPFYSLFAASSKMLFISAVKDLSKWRSDVLRHFLYQHEPSNLTGKTREITWNHVPWLLPTIDKSALHSSETSSDWIASHSTQCGWWTILWPCV